MAATLVMVAVVLVVVVATSSMPVARGEDLEKDDASTSCPGEYSKLCGKDPTCIAMVETACRTDADSVESIKGMFAELAKVGGDSKGFAFTEWPWGHVALCAAVNEHGACPGNKTVEELAGEHCINDLSVTCLDPICHDGARVECYRTAARFCYIKATPADKKAIEEKLKCFKGCCAQKKKGEECRKECILKKSPPAA
ncbi:unnamed protein product [Triticum aestivum]|uniref:Uncharacterized protein n=2 Tax=Triticum aestivum TaxID=4565 RepID=A0A9R1JDA3_WHEAT|nr:hypothetical protein CFC21_026969 [Triticum aestivum]SPT15433.1 unnamed protein product [Triticum aestivum]